MLAREAMAPRCWHRNAGVVFKGRSNGGKRGAPNRGEGKAAFHVRERRGRGHRKAGKGGGNSTMKAWRAEGNSRAGQEREEWEGQPKGGEDGGGRGHPQDEGAEHIKQHIHSYAYRKQHI
eukprot:357208-Chlamydomonas_euryale.AAC.3